MRKFSFPYRHRQIFMIPNRFGFLAVSLFIVFSLVAATYSNNLLFLLAFLHVSFLLVAILQTARNLRHIDIEAVQIPAGFPGETVEIKVLIKQNARAPKLGLTVFCEKSQKLIEELPEKDQKIITLLLQLPQTRGQHRLKRIGMGTESPYGLFYGWLYFKVNTPYFVYPRPVGNTLALLSHHQGSGDFSGLKNYQLGDSPQRISWKHSSRSEQLLVKEFKESAEPQCLLRWQDCLQTDDEGKLQQLARWIVDCEGGHFTYSLELPGANTTPGFDSGAAHFHRNLLALARWQVSP